MLVKKPGFAVIAVLSPHVLEVVPKTPNRFLIRGRIWVDAEDYAITGIEGTPARNPSSGRGAFTSCTVTARPVRSGCPR